MLVVSKEEYEKGSIKFQKSIDLCETLIIELDKTVRVLVNLRNDFVKGNIPYSKVKRELTKTLFAFTNNLTRFSRINAKYLGQDQILAITDKLEFYDKIEVEFTNYLELC